MDGGIEVNMASQQAVREEHTRAECRISTSLVLHLQSFSQIQGSLAGTFS